MSDRTSHDDAPNDHAAKQTNAPAAGDGGSQPFDAAASHDYITILHTTSGYRLSKHWRREGNIEGYNAGKYFSVGTERVDDINELSRLLTRLDTDRTACIIRGKYTGAGPARDSEGREHREGKTLRRNTSFEEQPLHSLLIEVDDYETMADPNTRTEEAIREYVTKELPACFASASYHWQLSNSAGHPSKAGLLKVHLWFFSAMAWTSKELRTWARETGLKADASVFQRIQIHYTAAPKFERGVSDPIARRSGFHRGEHDALQLDITEAINASECRREEAKAAAAERNKQRERERLTGGDSTSRLIDFYNAHHALADVMASCGYETDDGIDWRSPLQTSDSYATRLHAAEGYWVSLSDSDAAAGLGIETEKGNRTGDAYDLFLHFAHKGDHEAAWREIGSIKRRLERRDAAEEFESEEELREHMKAQEADSNGFDPIDMMGEDDAVGIDDEAATEEERQARREQQRRANERMGAGTRAPFSTMPEIFSLKDMLSRFCFISDGSQVADIENPLRVFSRADFANTHLASTAIVVNAADEEKVVPVAELWMSSRIRQGVSTTTFKPGDGRFTRAPRTEATAINTWTPFRRREPSGRYDENVAAFEGHVRYLFGEDTDRFLDWLAHIEQEPGVLPHTAWLHVSSKTGTGRNWLASVLTRVWRRHVAPGFDIAGCLDSGFNGRLSGALLAIVDEIREGGSEQWRHSEAMKRLITEEFRHINPKYGRQSVEYNCCRFLLFSNHVSAIPLDQTDRRFECVVFEGHPQTEAYYGTLYPLLKDGGFINDVAQYLARRDLSSFQPGRHAKRSEAKARVVGESMSEPSIYGQAVAAHWPSDVIVSKVLASIISPEEGGEMTGRARRVASECGIRPEPNGRVFKFNGTPRRIYIIRNHEQWKGAPTHRVIEEAQRGMPAHCWGGENFDLTLDWREYLDGLIARYK